MRGRRPVMAGPSRVVPSRGAQRGVVAETNALVLVFIIFISLITIIIFAIGIRPVKLLPLIFFIMLILPILVLFLRATERIIIIIFFTDPSVPVTKGIKFLVFFIMALLLRFMTTTTTGDEVEVAVPTKEAVLFILLRERIGTGLCELSDAADDSTLGLMVVAAVAVVAIILCPRLRIMLTDELLELAVVELLEELTAPDIFIIVDLPSMKLLLSFGIGEEVFLFFFIIAIFCDMENTLGVLFFIFIIFFFFIIVSLRSSIGDEATPRAKTNPRTRSILESIMVLYYLEWARRL